MPQIIAEFITVWGVHSLVYAVERGILRAQVNFFVVMFNVVLRLR